MEDEQENNKLNADYADIYRFTLIKAILLKKCKNQKKRKPKTWIPMIFND